MPPHWPAREHRLYVEKMRAMLAEPGEGEHPKSLCCLCSGPCVWHRLQSPALSTQLVLVKEQMLPAVMLLPEMPSPDPPGPTKAVS